MKHAFKYYSNAADNNYAKAFTKLGHFYYSGINPNDNYNLSKNFDFVSDFFIPIDKE